MAYIYQVTIGDNTYPVAASLYGTCSTAVGTAAKTVTLSSFDNYRTGIILAVKFTNGNSAASVTLNVNSKGEKNVYVDGAASTADNFKLAANTIVLFVYDGTQFNVIGVDKDINVRQNPNNVNKAYPILLSTSSSGNVTTGETQFNQNYTMNLSTGALKVGSICTDGTHFYEIGEAAEHGVDTTVSTGSSNLVTSGAVATAIEQAATGGVAYKGALNNTSGDGDYWQTKLMNTALTAGWYYVATAAFSIDTQDVEIGDMVFVNTSGTYTTAAQVVGAIDVVQGELDAMTTSDIDTAVASA